MSTEISGTCDERFIRFKDAFRANFDAGLELGSSLAVCHRGEMVVDLWAGSADREQTRPWQRDTIVQVYSLTKMRRNVWMELSGIPPKRIMQYFPEIDRVADRVIWGSDWPSSPAPSVLIQQMRQLPLSSDIIEAFLWSNADDLFKLS